MYTPGEKSQGDSPPGLLENNLEKIVDTKKAFEYAMALAPAIVCVLSLVLPLLKRWVESAYEDLHVVELVKDMAVHAAFYGSGATAFFGFKGASYSWVLALLWFVASVKIAYICALRIQLLSQGDDHA